MSEIRFSPGHLWVMEDGAGPAAVVLLGVTDYLQDQLGDVVSVDLPDFGDLLEAGRRCGRVESEEASAPLVAPVTGEVLEVNADVLAHPELINQDPYGSGWVLRVRLDDPTELDGLLGEAEYLEETADD